jgi:hypothetical protein
LIGQVSESLNLLFPFGLQRGRRDDQHVVGLAEPVQQGAGSNSLDGLAQAHFIGQQRALGKGQVQHALPLVREERHLGFVCRPFAALHLQLIVAPQLLALLGVASSIEPRAEFLRQAQARRPAGVQLLECLNSILGQALAERAVSAEPSLQGPRHGAIPIEYTDRGVGRVGHYVQTQRAILLRRAEQPFETGLKLQEHRLDVLTRAQPIDAEIHAIARELPLPNVADFHRVSQAAAGPDAEVREDWMARVGVGYAEFLRLRPRAAAVDFVLVRRAPIMRRRHTDFR